MIELDSVEVVYAGGARALAPTSIIFDKGGFTVLLGPSGAGKSTLLRVMNGLVRQTGGTLRVDEIGIVDNARNLRRHRRSTGMVFQQHQLIGRLTAHHNVMLGRLGYHSGLRTMLPLSRSEKVLGLEALDRVGLIELANRRVDQMSGGQQQRVGIARALVQQPRLVLADEPVASLDPATAEQVLSLIHGICRQAGIAAIVSLHQVDLARQFADRIVGLSAGRVVFDGRPEALDGTAIHRIYGQGPAHRDTAPSIQTKERLHEPQTVAA